MNARLGFTANRLPLAVKLVVMAFPSSAQLEEVLTPIANAQQLDIEHIKITRAEVQVAEHIASGAALTARDDQNHGAKNHSTENHNSENQDADTDSKD